MRNSVFREADFKIMEEFLYSKGDYPIDHFYRTHFDCEWFRKCSCKFYPNDSFIIVYLEDIIELKEQGERCYQLLLDFFTLYDYIRFIELFGGAVEADGKEKESVNAIVPRSTFFQIVNCKHQDGLIRGAHYYLNLRELENRLSRIEAGAKEGFPLLFIITLHNRNKRGGQNGAPLLYLTDNLIYPQWVFSSLQDRVILPKALVDNHVLLKVWDVDQGNFNEVVVGKKPYVLYDAGSEVYHGTMPFCLLLKKLQDELDKGDLPLFVLSHWHVDHYSLLFALSDSYLEKIDKCVFPSYVKSLSVYNFIVRLNLLGVKVRMIYLPYVDDWSNVATNDNLRLYANKYCHSSPNNSGLTLFVQGITNNAMLPGDCRYALAEAQANDSIIYEMGRDSTHYLVIPHHCGAAGKVTYGIRNAKHIEGIVSVGKNRRHGHPNGVVQSKIESIIANPLVMTKDSGDIDVWL